MNGWRRGVRSNKTCAAIFVTAFFAATLFATPRSSAAEIQTAAWMPGGELRHEAALPHVLATADAERYRLIFLLEGSGQWEAADREINGLKDRLLLGHVLALRYLHPRYRATYDELAHWLDSYADQPDAKAIYSLAQKRAPTAAAEPRRRRQWRRAGRALAEGPRRLARGSVRRGGDAFRDAGEDARTIALDGFGGRFLGGPRRAQEPPSRTCRLLARHRRRAAAYLLRVDRAQAAGRRCPLQFRR